MAPLPTGFKERLEQMELTRIQRLSLLQASLTPLYIHTYVHIYIYMNDSTVK